jgi:hypothetical protein
MGESKDQRRRATRFQMKLPVDVNLPSDNGPLPAQALTRDVSFRGLYFTMDQLPETGSHIDFTLTLPKELTLSSEVRIRCVGRVVRVETGVGSSGEGGGKPSVGVAAVIERYTFLPLEPAVASASSSH